METKTYSRKLLHPQIHFYELIFFFGGFWQADKGTFSNVVHAETYLICDRPDDVIGEDRRGGNGGASASAEQIVDTEGGKDTLFLFFDIRKGTSQRSIRNSPE